MHRVRLKLSLTPLMTSSSDELESSFRSWLDANGLTNPRDFKFAFTSAQRAAEACPSSPSVAADAWSNITHREVEVTTSWALWIRNRRLSAVQMTTHSKPKAPPKIWKGLRARKARADLGPANDLARRRAAAKDALRVALSWKGRGRLAGIYCGLQPTKRDAWLKLQTDRVARTEANTILSAMRTWKHWCAWCLGQDEDPLSPSEVAPTAFLYAPTQTRTPLHVPRTVPVNRFNHLRWIETHLGSPVRLEVSDRPASQPMPSGLAPEQRVASDPEVHLHLDRLFSQMPDSDPAKIVVAVIQLLWMSVLRFQHMQRSMPTRISSNFLFGVCWKGKGKPGYRWACPRFGPADADVGMFIWDRWQSLARTSAEAPFGLLYEGSSPFSLADFHTASRAVLRQHLGMREVDIFSSYSLRRSMPTLAEMNATHPDDADALGDWTSTKSSRMRIRYADSREERSAVVKLTHVLLVRQMAKSDVALSWDSCRHLLCSVDKAHITAQANAVIAGDLPHQETPEALLGGLAKPKRKFDIPALAMRMGAQRRRISTDALPSQAGAASSSQGPVHGLPIVEGASSRRWVMIKHRGAPHVHLLQTGCSVPLCRRRQGDRGKPITRLQSEGEGIPSLVKLGWNGPAALCRACFAALPGDEKRAMQGP